MILHCKLDGTELIWFSHVNISGSHIYNLLLTFTYFALRYKWLEGSVKMDHGYPSIKKCVCRQFESLMKTLSWQLKQYAWNQPVANLWFWPLWVYIMRNGGDVLWKLKVKAKVNSESEIGCWKLEMKVKAEIYREMQMKGRFCWNLRRPENWRFLLKVEKRKLNL